MLTPIHSHRSAEDWQLWIASSWRYEQKRSTGGLPCWRVGNRVRRRFHGRIRCCHLQISWTAVSWRKHFVGSLIWIPRPSSGSEMQEKSTILEEALVSRFTWIKLTVLLPHMQDTVYMPAGESTTANTERISGFTASDPRSNNQNSINQVWKNSVLCLSLLVC